MKLREIPRAYAAYSRSNPDSTVPHLVVGPASSSSTFCGLRVVAGAEGTRFETVCPRCVSTAKHMGCRP